MQCNFIDLSIRNKYSTSPYLQYGGKIMKTNSYLISNNSKYSAELQNDGNFVVYV